MWEVTTRGFEDSEPVLHQFNSVLFACPSVQARRVLAASPGELGDRCPELPSSTKWVCMLVIDDEAGMCRNLEQAEVDQQHGVESIRIEDRHENQVALVVSMNDQWSKAHQSYTKDDALPLLVEAASRTIYSHLELMHHDLNILHARSHRWGLARATAWVEEACDYDPDLRLGFAGDWFSGPEGLWRDAEAAFLSGVSLANAFVASQ
jgi:predicted NAD/FAD-dependent oxidoreductase